MKILSAIQILSARIITAIHTALQNLMTTQETMDLMIRRQHFTPRPMAWHNW
jgi:hypothetical protein